MNKSMNSNLSREIDDNMTSGAFTTTLKGKIAGLEVTINSL